MHPMRPLAMRYLGRPVVAHATDGASHYGILHHVSDDGIYLRRMSGGTLMKGQMDASVVPLNQLKNDGETDLAFFPFFFLPFFALAALGPWWWW